MRLSGLGYDNSDDTDYAYMYILSAFHGYPIDECTTVAGKLERESRLERNQRNKTTAKVGLLLTE